MTDRYTNEHGEVAVLFSPGFGAGWSTWNDYKEEAEILLFNPELVQAVLDKKSTKEIEAIAERLVPGGYFGGACDLTVLWLEPGTIFCVEEYDGSESIRTYDDRKFRA